MRILGGSGYTITNNYIGGSAALATGSNATYATSSGNLSYQGILLNTSSAIPESNIQGNTIAKINITSFPTVKNSTAFIGIETNGSGINIGGTGEGNLVGSNTANSSIVITTSTGTSTFNTYIRGIYCYSSGGVIIGNQVGGIDIKNIGSSPAPSAFIGIYINNATAPSKVNNNIIGSAGTGAATNSVQVLSTSTAITTSLTGISVGTSVGSAIQLDSNIIKNLSHLSNAIIVSAGGIIGISTAAKNTAELTITNNTIANNTNSPTFTTGLLYGIQNTGASATLKVNNNSIYGNTINSVASVYNAIRNTGVVFNTIEINGNSIGNNSSPAVNFTAANSASQFLIYNTGGSSGASLSINNNDFQNVNYNANNGTGGDTYISNTAVTLSQAIVGNSFTNLNIQTTGSNVFITNTVVVPAAGSQNISNNFISGTYTKKAGGTLTLLTSTAACAIGSTININNNNFSNITVNGATTIAGLVNTDAGNSNKTIQGNTFYNWIGGTSAITVMNVNLSATNNATSGNIIRNISSAGTITGITTAAGNDNIYGNTIDSLFSTGGTTTVVSGINVTGGTSKNIYQNTISNLQGNSITTGSVRGILISGGTTVNFYQNTIYGLTANALTTGTLSGIWNSAGTTIKIFRNKIYDISSSSSAIITAVVYGIQVSGATANLNSTLNNNIIGDIRSTAASLADAIRGIGIISTGTTSTTNVYYNTIYLNASSSGLIFGTSGIYHATSGTATTSTLNLINNNITNVSVPNSVGLTVAYRRSSATLTNYGATSNNNMFYAGTQGPFKLIFNDGTNSDQTLAAYKSRVTTRDAASITEDLIGGSIFLSTIGSAISYLHIDLNKTTALRSAGVNITGFTDDFDGDIRFGNAGYAGNGTAPDIGADEFAGLQFLPFSGIYNVGAGQNYISLTNTNGIFAKINSLGLSGNVTINITSDLSETGAEALNQWTEFGAGNYSITIQPDASTPRLIYGDVVAGMIRFNGADRVRVDGGTSRLLTFRNTNATGTSGTAFSFINGATYDTIRYCKLESYANATNGVVLFSTAVSGATGNSNNLLEYNTINGTYNLNTSLVAIYSSGTTGKENSGNVVSNNTIYDYRDRAIDITATGSTLWTISNNSFYNGNVSASVNYPASSDLHGIRILGGSGYSILNNYIGGNAALTTGTNATYASTLGNIGYQGILLTTTSAIPASSIKGNTIAKISLSYSPVSSSINAFTGIETNGSGISIGGSSPGQGNLIGSNATNGSIVISTATTSATYTSIIRGINCLSNGGIVTGNQIGGFDISNTGAAPAPSAFTGIYVNNATAPTQVNSNIIGSAGSGAATNSIRVMPGSSALTNTIRGIEVGNTVASTIQLNANIVQNLANLSGTSSGSFTGINNTASVSGAVITISNNVIKNVSSAANSNINSAIYTGINSASPSTISNDTITNITLSASGTAAQIKGIVVSGAFVHSIHDNIISAFSTASTKVADVETGAPSNYTISGILNTASVAGQAIYSNTLSDFSSTTTDVTNTAIAGIGVGTAGFSGNIYKNRIVSFSNTSTGISTLPGITGIAAMNGTANVYNNVIKFDNAGNSNGVKLYGINHSTSNAWNFYYNSVTIGGSSSGTAARSAGFVRTVNGSVILKNNLLINTRTGTGSHYGISNKAASPATNWSASDFNDLYSSTGGTTAEWGNGGANTFAQWQTNSGGDANSVNRSVSFIASVYDLQPDPKSNCAIDNSGTVISAPIAINTDIDGITRNVSTPDMGAYEFAYAVFVVTDSSSSPVCSGSNLNLFLNPGSAISPSFSWRDPLNAIVSTLQNPTVTAMAGNYTVTVTDINGCTAGPVSTTVTLYAPPVTSLSYPGSPYCTHAGIANITFSGTTGGTFSSTAGLTINAATGAVTLASTADGTYKVTYTITGGCSVYTDSAFITINTLGNWLGTVSSDWNNAANWPCGVIPTGASDVVIAAGLPFYPIINAGTTATVHNLTVQSGASLTVDNNTLQIAGTIVSSSNFNVQNGTVEMNGTSTQTIPAAAFTANKIKNLIVSNDVTLAGVDSLTGVLSFGSVDSKTFSTGGFLTLRSTAAGTAIVADLTNNDVNSGNQVLGAVTVERYLSAVKKWRFLTVPTSTTQTVKATWQENSAAPNDNLIRGYGTQITGPGDTTAGFDLYTAAPSMKTYDSSTNSWKTIPNTKSYLINTLSNNTIAYMVLVRGDRGATTFTSPVTSTTLRTKGVIKQGDQPVVTIASPATAFTAVGNPYPSYIDLRKMTPAPTTATKIYVWDPLATIGSAYGLGAYQTLTFDGSDFSVTPGGGSYGAPYNQDPNRIESGSAFFVGGNDSSYTITFREDIKPSGNFIISSPARRREYLEANLFINNNGNTALMDGVKADVAANFLDKLDDNDAYKILNSSENVSLKRNGALLSVERHHTITANDTFYLNLSNMKVQNYQWQLKMENMDQPGLTGFLEDNFTNTRTSLNLNGNNNIDFNVINAAASYAADRFKVVFAPAKILAVSFTNIRAYQQNTNVNVEWKVENEINIRQYEIEKSIDGNSYIKAGSAVPRNTPVSLYTWTDAEAATGYNYYRIKSVDVNGKIEYSKVVKVFIEKGAESISIYPNPVQYDIINLHLTNQNKGVYEIRLLNQLGQLLISKKVDHNGGSKIEKIPFGKNSAQGIYKLEVTKPGGDKVSINVLH